MSVIPCQQNEELKRMIEDYVEVLKTDAHKIGAHALLPLQGEGTAESGA